MDFNVATLAIGRAVRLVTTARLRDPVLQKLVTPDFADDLAEIEGATSGRLREEKASADAYPRGRPQAAFVNAAFAYFRPREMNRFNGPGRGAWYAALELETSVAEVAHHLRRELAWVGDFNATVDYAEMWASFAGAFVDLRGFDPRPRCLDPDPALGYPAGNALAAEAMSAGQTASSTRQSGMPRAPASSPCGRTWSSRLPRGLCGGSPGWEPQSTH